jgi:mono/diheme cytochrome c family protein
MSHTSQDPGRWRRASTWHWPAAALSLLVLVQEPTFTPAQTAAGLKLFDDHVRHILVEHCVQCHGGKETEADFDLTTREGLLKGGLTDKAIVPGKSADSFLVYLIRHEDDPHMPEDAPKLPDAQIAHIARWIDAGAPYSAPLPKTAPKEKGVR